MAKRFAIVIGVAGAGVMALGAQTVLAGQPVDTIPPDLQLSGKKTQELGNAVKVKASCGNEACTASGDGGLARDDGGFGGLKPASADLAPGETTTLKLKLTKKGRKKARKALDDGQKVQALVFVEATDAAGNTTGCGSTRQCSPQVAVKRTIKLVK